MGGAREEHMFKPGNKLSYTRSYKKIVETKVARNCSELKMCPHVYRRLTSCSLGNLNIVFAEGLGPTVFKFDFRMKCSKQKLLKTVKNEEIVPMFITVRWTWGEPERNICSSPGTNFLILGPTKNLSKQKLLEIVQNSKCSLMFIVVWRLVLSKTWT